jgi:hypothetical protein
MQDHSTGASEGVRQGSNPVDHSLSVNYNSKVDRKWLRVRASAVKPILVEIREVGVTVFNAGTTNQYRLGTASAGAQLLALRNTPAAAAVAVVTSFLLVANTDIWVGTSLTGTAATTGAMYLIAQMTELNVADVNANAIP